MLHHLLLWALTPCLFIYLQDYFIYWCLKPKRTTRSRSRTISWGGSANLVSCPAAPAPGIICFQRLMSCKTLPCLPHMDNPPMHTHWSIILLSNFMSIVQFHPIADAFFHISPIHLSPPMVPSSVQQSIWTGSPQGLHFSCITTSAHERRPIRCQSLTFGLILTRSRTFQIVLQLSGGWGGGGTSTLFCLKS